MATVDELRNDFHILQFHRFIISNNKQTMIDSD